MSIRAVDRIARQLTRQARGGAEVADLFRLTVDELKRETTIDGWCGLNLDPATLLMTGGIHEHGLPQSCMQRLLEIECEGDAHPFASLAAAARPVGVLSADGGPPSRRLSEVLLPSGYAHELRVVLPAGGRVWGALVAMRRAGESGFDADDEALFEAIAAPLGQAIRASLLAASATLPPSGARAVVVFDARGELASASPEARRLLEDLAEVGPPDPRGIPHTVQFLVNEARALAAARPEDASSPRSRARTRSGRWLTLEATSVASAGGDSVVVVIEPSRPLEIASLILDAYGLSPREGEVVRHVLQGFDTEQIARGLGISAYTVQDHLKSIFDKLGVSSRKELVARIFFAHYLPRMMEGARLDHDGWFAPRPAARGAGPAPR